MSNSCLAKRCKATSSCMRSRKLSMQIFYRGNLHLKGGIYIHIPTCTLTFFYARAVSLYIAYWETILSFIQCRADSWKEHAQAELSPQNTTYLCPSFGPLEMDAECHTGNIMLNVLFLLSGSWSQMCSDCLCLVLNFQRRYKHLGAKWKWSSFWAGTKLEKVLKRSS